jgi:hypothetical protein
MAKWEEQDRLLDILIQSNKTLCSNEEAIQLSDHGEQMAVNKKKGLNLRGSV